MAFWIDEYGRNSFRVGFHNSFAIPGLSKPNPGLKLANRLRRIRVIEAN